MINILLTIFYKNGEERDVSYELMSSEITQVIEALRVDPEVLMFVMTGDVAQVVSNPAIN